MSGAEVSSLPARVGGSLRIARAVFEARRVARSEAAARRRAQERRIAAIVAHAHASVPFYAEEMRSFSLTPADVRSAADLAHLPIVERRSLQREPERWRSRAMEGSPLLTLRTGGSSGAPLAVQHDVRSLLDNTGHGERHAMVLRRLVGKLRFRSFGIGSPRGADVEIRAFVRRHALVPVEATGARRRCTMAEDPAAVAAEIARTRPDVVHGYGSYVERVAQILEERHSGCGVPRVFAYGGDGMSPGGRARIVERLGCAVWSSYQAVESLKIAFECGHGTGLHVHTDLCALRIVDEAGRDVAPGATGEVLISNLVNRATVLLNYRLGDQAAFSVAPCPCGSTSPLLTFPEGRVEDWFALPSGARVYTQRLRALFTDEAQVWQYQIVQESPSAVRVAVVVAEGADRSALASRLGTRLASVLGPEVALVVDFVHDLERTPEGKLRTVLRRPGAGGQAATPDA